MNYTDFTELRIYILSVLGLVHLTQLSAKCCRVSHKAVSWGLSCLSFLCIMISLNASTLQFPLYLPMTLNAYWLSNQQVTVTNSNKTSTTYYLPGATLSTFLISLNLYNYASGKKLHLTHQDMQSTAI